MFCGNQQTVRVADIKKTRMMPLPECEKNVTITGIRLDTVPAMDRQRDRWTDRQTDGQTDRQIYLVKQYCAVHALHADVQ